jgi:hypothetical protein
VRLGDSRTYADGVALSGDLAVRVTDEIAMSAETISLQQGTSCSAAMKSSRDRHKQTAYR